MRILLVGHGRMGRLVGDLAPEYGIEVAGVIDPQSPLHAGGPEDDRWRGVDVAIDFTFPDAVKTNAPALARQGINLVIGTTGWKADEPAVRQAVADAGVGVVAAPNFSVGVVLFEAIVARAAALFAAQQEFGAFLHEAHHAAKKDAPSGTALFLKDAMVAGRLPTGDRRLVHPRRLHSRDAYRRLRRPGRDDRPVARRPRSHRVCARGAHCGKVGGRPPRLVHNEGRVGSIGDEMQPPRTPPTRTRHGILRAFVFSWLHLPSWFQK